MSEEMGVRGSAVELALGRPRLCNRVVIQTLTSIPRAAALQLPMALVSPLLWVAVKLVAVVVLVVIALAAPVHEYRFAIAIQ
jgi:hypothetical protein